MFGFFRSLFAWFLRKTDYRQCQYREEGSCGIMRGLVKAQDPSLCAVTDEFCDMCYAQQAPTKNTLNPLLAQRLVKITLPIIEQGGVPGCSRQRAQALHDYTQKQITLAKRKQKPGCSRILTRECKVKKRSFEARISA